MGMPLPWLNSAVRYWRVSLGVIQDRWILVSESSSEFGELLDAAYVRMLIKACKQERFEGTHPEYVSEGQRIANEFRKKFPDVSDKDLGTFMVVLTRAVTLIGQSTAFQLSQSMDIVISTYSHAAANILESVQDLNQL